MLAFCGDINARIGNNQDCFLPEVPARDCIDYKTFSHGNLEFQGGKLQSNTVH